MPESPGNIVKCELGDSRIELHEVCQGLADATCSSKHSHLPLRHGAGALASFLIKLNIEDLIFWSFQILIGAICNAEAKGCWLYMLLLQLGKLSLLDPFCKYIISIPPSPYTGYGMNEKPVCLKWSLSPMLLGVIAHSSTRFCSASPFQVWTCVVEESLIIDADGNELEEDQSVQINRNTYNREMERRRKIGLANKGKVPWNVGRKHSEVTRERIRQRTREALRDPKVRKKMAEHPRPHSDQIKEKIGSSLRRIWRERLKEKRMKEKIFLSWYNNIARVAKKGLADQEEMDWDSFDKIKFELAQQKLKRMAEKEAAKIIAKERAQRAAVAKAEKLARLAQKRKEREEKRKEREEKNKTTLSRKSKENKDDSKVTELKQRLEKIQRKKPVTVHTSRQRDVALLDPPLWEKIDLECIRKEKAKNGVSLADQIRAAKNKRAESAPLEQLSA
ncbi:hypothetical protein SAY87_012161 [Trapa incisa]|uniref:Nuclease associated modular domain-containing protein n=1 Tax=Trapa incisa TaxID=236973 RepID=A0AAN7GPW6_9MYRT|nr:hypothetical protein SAY87_012161 [Trapa incisa]